MPAGAGQGRADGLGEAAMGVAGDPGDAVQAAGGQVPEEPQPPGAALGGADLPAADLPVALGVHAGREHRVDVDGPAGSRTFRTRASAARNVEGPASRGRVRNASTWASKSRAISLTCDLLSDVMPGC